MSRTLLRWALRLALVATVAAVVGRLLAGRSAGDGRVFPAITGDTWPPVPTNPDRRVSRPVSSGTLLVRASTGEVDRKEPP
ncbi:MAG: hypothetical protein ACLQOZ_03305 [Acidimicrobiales bacterium]|jgi:hypothetical protein